MAVLSSIMFIYCACFLLHQSHERRATLAVLKARAQFRIAARALAVIFLFVALLLLFPGLGFAQAIPIWLGLVSVLGGLNLWIASGAPGYHVASMQFAAAGACISFIFSVFEGGI